MNMVRYIRIPKDIALVDTVSGDPMLSGDPPTQMTVTFKSFLCGTLLRDTKFGKTVATVISAAAIRTAIESPKIYNNGYTFIAIEGADYDILKAVLEAPETGYNPVIAIQIVPFFRAILDATTTDPTIGSDDH